MPHFSPCCLCPHVCGVLRQYGQTGFCGCGDRPVIARAAPHYWEEPCISGSRGSGAVFFSGCNLGCVFCQNRELSRGHAGFPVGTERLSEIFLELQEKGVHNINLVTPTPWAEFIPPALELAWEQGLWIPVVYNCGGYELPTVIDSLRGYVGVYLPDFKYMDPSLAAVLSGAPDYPEIAKVSLDRMVAQRGEAVFDGDGMMIKGVIVRHLVLPGHTDDSVRILDYLHREYGNSIYISIMNQYTPMPGMTGELSRRLTDREYAEVVAYARGAGITNGFIQEGGTAEESFIPVWDGEGVVR